MFETNIEVKKKSDYEHLMFIQRQNWMLYFEKSAPVGIKKNILISW